MADTQPVEVFATPAKPVSAQGHGLPTPPHDGSAPQTEASASMSSPALVYTPALADGPMKQDPFGGFDAPPTPPRTPSASPHTRPPSPFPWLTTAPALRQRQHSTASAAPSLEATLSRTSIASAPSTPAGFEHLDFGADYYTTSSTPRKEPRSFEWEWCVGEETDGPTATRGPISGLFAPHASHLQRRLGPNETSYYLSSRGDGQLDPLAGVNDMYLHIGFSAPARLVTPERVLAIWTEMRLRHTLLSSQVDFRGYEDIHFVYRPPQDVDEASQRASETLEFAWNTSRDAALDAYLNGPRTLSDQHLAGLRITSPAAARPEDPEERVEFDYWLFATHFLGDGMALHTFSNIFFGLLEGKLEQLAADEGLQWDVDGFVPVPPIARLPPAMESRIATPGSWGRFAWAAARVEFQRNQGQLIGGQTFPRRKSGQRKTVVPTIAFSAAETSAILKKCKANGCTIAHAVFALSNVAHMRIIEEDSSLAVPQWSAKARDPGLPTMLYSALNLRPNMVVPEEVAECGQTPDFFHLVIGYYNVILPTFKPAGLTEAQIFWHRARETKAQSLKATKSKWLTQRSKLMSLDRERRSIGFERAADLKRCVSAKSASTGLGLDVGVAPPPSVPDLLPEIKKTQAPSLALLGVSMLGNLDGMYKHAEFPSIKLHTLTTGSRQRPGGMLLFAYTFAGQLWFSLGYDAHGFESGCVEKFWTGVQAAAREFLLDDRSA